MIQTKGYNGTWIFHPTIKTLMLYAYEVKEAHPHFTTLELKEELLKNMRDCDCEHKEEYNGWADVTVSKIIDNLAAWTVRRWDSKNGIRNIQQRYHVRP